MTKEFTCPIYDMPFNITFDRKLIKKLEEEYKDGDAAMVSYPENEFPYIFIDPEHYTIGVVCHESYHLACHFYEGIGAKLDICNQEPFAYLLEWITITVDNYWKSKDVTT